MFEWPLSQAYWIKLKGLRTNLFEKTKILSGKCFTKYQTVSIVSIFGKRPKKFNWQHTNHSSWTTLSTILTQIKPILFLPIDIMANRLLSEIYDTRRYRFLCYQMTSDYGKQAHHCLPIKCYFVSIIIDHKVLSGSKDYTW